jgi:glycogen debranching enzyme
VANVIGRNDWIVTDQDYLPYFAWDGSFNALLASLEDPEHAKATMRALLAYQLPNGMVAQIANWDHDPLPHVNVRNSNPPVTSLCAWKLYERWPDRKFLHEVYSKLLRWHDWWPKFSDGNHNGLLEWGAAGRFEDARNASGWDDMPAFDGAEKIGTQMNADAVDLNSLWSMDAEYLSKMAGELGLRQDAIRLQREHLHMNSLVNDLLWNEELGVYCSRLWGKDGTPGKFLTRLTPMNFYPLICGTPDARRANRMLETLTDPRRFWGDWPVPTLAYDDPDWPKQDYWKGHTWAPVNYLIWQGLRRYGTQKQKLEFAQRSVDLFMRNWTRYGTCNETYKSSDGSGDRYPHYTWGALLCQIGIEFFYDANAAGPPTLSKDVLLLPDVELHNMPSGGGLYRIISNAGQFNAVSEG